MPLSTNLNLSHSSVLAEDREVRVIDSLIAT